MDRIIMALIFNKDNIFSGGSKTLWKLFLLIFIISVITINWNSISWLFHYRAAPEGIQSVVLPEREREFTDEEDSIKIEAINITAPLILPDGESNLEIYNALKKGVVHFPNSALPGEKGVMILLGHSSPPGWPKIDYDWVFTEVELLQKGDEIRVSFNGEVFTYIITEKIFLEIGQDVSSYGSDKREIILLSCWPPGKNIKRIGVRGVLKY